MVAALAASCRWSGGGRPLQVRAACPDFPGVFRARIRPCPLSDLAAWKRGLQSAGTDLGLPHSVTAWFGTPDGVLGGGLIERAPPGYKAEGGISSSQHIGQRPPIRPPVACAPCRVGVPALVPCPLAAPQLLRPAASPGSPSIFRVAPLGMLMPLPLRRSRIRPCAGHDWAGRGQNGGPPFSGGGPLGGLPAPARNAICSPGAFLNPARSSWTHIMETPIASATAAFLEHSRFPATTYSTLV